MKANTRGGSHLYYELHGTQGPHLLMVHGLMSSRAQWVPNLKAFTAFCRPVIVELFGHGRSPSPENPEAYFPESYVREFEIIRQETCSENWFVCGQSLGAALTLRYSLLYPERIKAQIFTNSLSALSDAGENENMERLVGLMLQGGRGALDRFPLNPSRSRFLDTIGLYAEAKRYHPRVWMVGQTSRCLFNGSLLVDDLTLEGISKCQGGSDWI